MKKILRTLQVTIMLLHIQLNQKSLKVFSLSAEKT